MRGADHQQRALFREVAVEQRVPQDYPLRKRLPRVKAALVQRARRG